MNNPSPPLGLFGEVTGRTSLGVPTLFIPEDYPGYVNDGQSGNASSYQVGLVQSNYVHLSSMDISQSPVHLRTCG